MLLMIITIIIVAVLGNIIPLLIIAVGKDLKELSDFEFLQSYFGLNSTEFVMTADKMLPEM